MSKPLKVFVLLSALLLPLIFPKTGQAATCSVSIEGTNELPPDYNGTITVIPDNQDCFPNSQQFIVAAVPPKKDVSSFDGSSFTQAPLFATTALNPFTPATGIGVDCTSGTNGKYCGKLQGTLDFNKKTSSIGTNIFYLHGIDYVGTWNLIVCAGGNGISLKDCKNPIATGSFKITSTPSSPSSKPAVDLPEIASIQNRCLFRSGDDDVVIKVTNIYPEAGVRYHWWWAQDFAPKFNTFATTKTSAETELELLINRTDTTAFDGIRRLCVDYDPKTRSDRQQNCINLKFQKSIIEEGTNTSCDPDTKGPSNECTEDLKKICAGKKVDNKSLKCEAGKCILPTASSGEPCDDIPKNPGIKTAIGCIHTEPIALIKDFLKFITAVSGGIAFLMMLLGAFQMITSAGNPETLQAGRDRFQSAIIGLLFVIFAVLLLKIIGVDILGLGTQFGIKIKP